MCAYRQGLNPSIYMQMAIYDNNVGLESFMQRASRISQCLAAWHSEEAPRQLATPAYSSPVPEPIQVDSTQLSRMERACRLVAGLCLYCAASDYYIRTCPVRPPRPAYPLSSGNFISQRLLKHLDLPRKRQPRELRVETIQGKPLGRGRVKYHAPLMTLRIGCLHEETILFLVLEGPTVNIILGRPWLNLHSWRSDGIPARLLTGARLAFTIVSPRYPSQS